MTQLDQFLRMLRDAGIAFRNAVEPQNEDVDITIRVDGGSPVSGIPGDYITVNFFAGKLAEIYIERGE